MSFFYVFSELGDKKPLLTTDDSAFQSQVIPEQDNEVQARSNLDLSTETELSSSFNIDQLQTLVDAGGPVIIILMTMSLIGVTIFFLKCWQFSWMGFNRYKAIHGALQLWYSNRADAAVTLLSETRNPIARVLEVAISLKIQKTDDKIAREEVIRVAKRQLASARSKLKILEVIATLSPLLGLLGTVLGMITAFQNLQNAGSTIDPALLSGGIWEALLTTAAGLIVAIPAVVALTWLEQRVERFKLVMEDTMTQVFTSEARTASVNSALASVAPAKVSKQKLKTSPMDETELALAT